MCVCVHSNVYLRVLIRRAARASTTDLHEALLFDFVTMLHVHYQNVICLLFVSPILGLHTIRRYLAFRVECLLLLSLLRANNSRRRCLFFIICYIMCPLFMQQQQQHKHQQTHDAHLNCRVL